MPPTFEMLVRVLDHHHRRVDHRADRDRDAPERHDVGVDALVAHHDEGGQDAQRQRDDGDEGRTQVEQEDEAHDCDDKELLEKLVAEVLDGALDQARAIVDRHDLHAPRQAALQVLQLGLDRSDRLERVLARAHDDDAAGGLALAVEFADAAPHLGADLHARHVTEAHRDPGVGRQQRHLAEIIQRLQIARRPHHVLGFAEFEHRAAAFLVGASDRVDHTRVRNAVGGELVGVEQHLVLAHHAADRGHLGDVRNRLQLELQEPVLQRTQLRHVECAAAVDQRVLIDPAHAGGIGPELRLGVSGQACLHLVQVLEHARARPVQVGAVLEQHVDEAVAEERVAAHRLGTGHRQHRRRQRIGDLVLDDAWGLPGIGRADDDLHVGQVGQRVQRRLQHRDHAPGADHQRGQQHQEAVGDRPADQPGDHGLLPEALAAADSGDGATSVIRVSCGKPSASMKNSKPT